MTKWLTLREEAEYHNRSCNILRLSGGRPRSFMQKQTVCFGEFMETL